MTGIKIIRGRIIAGTLSFRVPLEIYGRANFGSVRLDAAVKLLTEELGLEIEGIETMQVVPIAVEDRVEVRLRSQ